MSKLHAAPVVGKDQVGDLRLPEQVEVALHQLAGAAKEGLLAFSVGVGLNVLRLMMDEKLNEVVGPKGKHNTDRTATRHGSENGSVVLGGRKTSVTRPRARHLDGSGEVELVTYKHFCAEDLLQQMALERMVAGLSTRNYRAGLEPVGDVEATGTTRSSVSRRFVERTQSALKELMQRDLSDVDIVALLLDGVEIAEHTMVLALDIDAKGHKHPLGLREGTTENKGVCRGLLSNLIERGLDFSSGILVVIDGGKRLRAAHSESYLERRSSWYAQSRPLQRWRKRWQAVGWTTSSCRLALQSCCEQCSSCSSSRFSDPLLAVRSLLVGDRAMSNGTNDDRW